MVCLLFANASSDIANRAMINANAITVALYGRTVFVFVCILFRIRYRYKFIKLEIKLKIIQIH